MPLGLSHGRPGGRTPCRTPEVAAVLRPSLWCRASRPPCCPCSSPPSTPSLGAVWLGRARSGPIWARSGPGAPRPVRRSPALPVGALSCRLPRGLPRFCCCAPWWRHSCPRRPCLGVVRHRVLVAAHLRPLLASVPLRVGPAGGFAGWLRPSLLFAVRRPSCFSPRPAMAWLVVDAVRLAWRYSASRWPPSASLALVRVVWPNALLRRVLSVWWTATRPLARLATRTARAYLGLTTAFTLQAKASHLWCRCWRCPWVPFPC
jgi:hypothetical protein